MVTTRTRKAQPPAPQPMTEFLLRLPAGVHQEIRDIVARENKAKVQAGVRTGVSGYPWSNRITVTQWIRQAVIERLDREDIRAGGLGQWSELGGAPGPVPDPEYPEEAAQ